MTAVRDIQEMDNPERLRYFRMIDQLRGFGINEDLPLPQVSFRPKSYSTAFLTRTFIVDCRGWGSIQREVITA